MKKIVLEDVASLESILEMGKKRGLKYFEKAHKEFSIQDLCKHWKISSATFYNVYSSKIGYVPRQTKKAAKNNIEMSVDKDNTNLVNNESLVTNICECNPLDTNLSNNVSTMAEVVQPENEVVALEAERAPMEQFFKFTNCSDIERVQETLLKVNSLLSDGYTYDIEFKMIQR